MGLAVRIVGTPRKGVVRKGRDGISDKLVILCKTTKLYFYVLLSYIHHDLYSFCVYVILNNIYFTNIKNKSLHLRRAP